MDNRPEFFIHKFEDLIDMYDEVCIWFQDLGFPYTKNRYGAYKKHLTTLLDLTKNKQSLEENNDLMTFKKSFDNAYIEVNEIIRVFNNLKNIKTEEFLDQIRKVASGHEFRANTDNDPARDFLFELSVASRFIKANYPVLLRSICDVVVDLGQFGTLFVECKRIKSDKKISTNIKKANKQIIERTKSHPSSKAKGMIAINITDLLPKTNMFYPDSPQANKAIHQAANNLFLHNHILDIQAGMNNKTLGIMCESAMMHYFSPESNIPGFTYSRHTSFVPYAESELFEYLAPQLSRQDIV